MPSYLWSGKDSSGHDVTERVTAATPEEARDRLIGRGWTDLSLQTSEIHDFVKQGVQAVSDPAYRPQLTPQQELAFLRGTAPGFRSKWFNSIRESGGAFLSIVLALAAAVYYGQRYGILVFGGLLLALALLFPAIHFWFRRTSQLFHKLHRARNWRRWKEVLALLEALERAQKSRKIGIGNAEMARYRALALSGLGKLEEAVAAIRIVAAQSPSSRTSRRDSKRHAPLELFPPRPRRPPSAATGRDVVAMRDPATARRNHRAFRVAAVRQVSVLGC